MNIRYSRHLARYCLLSLLLPVMTVQAEAPNAEVAAEGEQLFKQHCSGCHTGFLGSRAPSPRVLSSIPAQSIIHALTTGVMRTQGYSLSGAQRRAIAEHLTGESLADIATVASGGQCQSNPSLTKEDADNGWNGWGNGARNTSFQSADRAALSLEQVKDLKLAWAFGFPDSYSAWAQPVVGHGRIYVGSQAGILYALDAKTGCTYWSYEAKAGLRSAVSIATIKGSDNNSDSIVVLFGDLSGNVYSLNAQTGALNWVVEVDDHPMARVTGSPTYHDGRLYVPMSSWTTVTSPATPCCTFRGSLSAVDVSDGSILWKTYTIPQPAKPLDKVSEAGLAVLGPAGSAIWSSPTVDAKRGVVYAATGNSYTEPAVNSDSVLAFDLEDGTIRWSTQATPDDIWIPACAESQEDCEYPIGKNYDFGAAPMLARLESGKELVVIGQKSGVAYALDPDNEGAIAWRHRVGEGGIAGGIVWGGAVDNKSAYFPLSDLTSASPGGIHAVDLTSGKKQWIALPVEPLCGTVRYGCNAAQPVAIAITDELLFAGSVDGGIRAYRLGDGKVVWSYDTNHEFSTVNGVPAEGGSLIGAGPTVSNGYLYVNSGYGTNGGRVGNVLLAFKVQPEH
ncbi:MAG: PQQ-binding-like beta-propeller repeat protein [Wenzhouxiangellaceae bacterium]